MTNTQSPAPGVAAEAKVVQLSNCFTVQQGGCVLGSFAGSEAKEHAEAFVATLRPAAPVAVVIESAAASAIALKLVKEVPIGTQLYTALPLPAQVQEAEVTEVIEMRKAIADFQRPIGNMTAEQTLQMLTKRENWIRATSPDKLTKLLDSLASSTPAPGMAPAAVKEAASAVLDTFEHADYPRDEINLSSVRLIAEFVAAPHPSPAPQAAGDAETEWLKFDIENPPVDGLYWVRSEAPEVDVDVDDYGQTVGRYTGDTEYSVALVVFHGVTDSRPDFEVLDKWNSGDLPSEGWVTHYLPVGKPAFPAAGRAGS